jgi:deoxycytidine triphosphate deaminase
MTFLSKWHELSRYITDTTSDGVRERTDFGILTGPTIRKAIELGFIEVDPLNFDHLNPASIDLTLGEEIKVYLAGIHWDPYDTPDATGEGKDLGPRIGHWLPQLDVRKRNETWSFTKKKGDRFLLKPGIGYLMHTAERVKTNHFQPVIDGKSSLGRLFISIHETAGYGEPGFNGQYTLEVTVTHPVWIEIGMRFCQMRFHTLCGPVELYDGHYTADRAKGAIPSRTWEQMTDDKIGEGQHLPEGHRPEDP